MERRKKGKGRNRLHAVRLSVSSTNFRFHIVIFRSHFSNGHASSHDYFILGFSSVSHLLYVVIVMFVYVYNI